ncbi:MAG: hypothetical protein M1828_003676 [Chrysothrix sp. TS-e1954]|nr:MAG: hypothetical protein M1828_003676 [Chrysothrix sp. TS-e1954]
MNPSDAPSEGPEHRTEPLSPVSPKPLHYPAPSNIPLLENQMDPSFTGSTEQSNPTAIPQSQSKDQDQGQPLNTSAVQINGGSQEGQNAPGTVAIEAQTVPGHTMSFEAPTGDLAENNASNANASTFSSLDQLLDNAQSNSSEMNAKAEAGPSTVFGSTDPAQLQAPGDVQSLDADMIQIPESQGQLEALAENQPGTVASEISSGDVNFQALLDRLSASASTSTAPSADALTAATTQSTEPLATEDSSKLMTAATALPGSTPTPVLSSGFNLPPRPPTQGSSDTLSLQQPDIRSFHPHDQTQPNQRSMPPPPGASFQIPNQAPPPLLTAGAPGTSLAAPGTSNAPINGLPPPPAATFQQSQQSPTTPGTQQDAIERPGSQDMGRNDDDDIPWAHAIQKEYDAFLKEERQYVTEGQWDRFPANSRLFIGNLPTEKVTKRDLYHVFHKYGKLAQVSIKQAYGFIQFLESEPCQRALKQEQAVAIRGRKVHLEISKPQGRNKQNDGGRNSRNRRSRSPDKGIDRYRTSGGGGGQNNNRNRGDGWRPNRSPSPRSRDRRRRSPDLYDGRSRFRSPPRGDADDDPPLPRRTGSQIPDVQILAKDEPDRAFLEYVEKSFETRGVRCDVLRLSPRLNESAVMRRQIIEGVLAVVKVNRMTIAMQKFQLDLFDRSGGSGDVKFQQYTELDLHICVELVLRARTTHRPPQNDFSSSPYGLPMVTNQQQPQQMPPMPQMHQQQQPRPPMPPFPQHTQHTPQPHGQMPTPHQYSPQTPSFPNSGDPRNLPLPPQNPGPQTQMNLSSAINNLDSSSLQQLLGSLQGPSATPNQAAPQHSPTTPSFQQHPHPQQQQQQQPSQSQVNDLARIFGTQAQMPPQQQSQGFQNLAQNPAFAGLFNTQQAGQGQPQQQQQQQQGQGQGQGQGGGGGGFGGGPQGGGGFVGQAQQGHGHGQGQGQGQGQPDMQNIMAQLARYGGR